MQVSKVDILTRYYVSVVVLQSFIAQRHAVLHEIVFALLMFAMLKTGNLRIYQHILGESFLVQAIQSYSLNQSLVV